MTADDLLDVLIDEIADDNTAFVTSLLATARAKIAAGGGLVAPLTSASLNGKNFNRDVRLDAVQVARVCRLALAHAEGGGVSATTLDFSRLS